MVRAGGGDATSHEADVALAGDNEAMVAAAERAYGRLDVMFNNAGIMHSADDDAVSTEEDIWDLTMDINAKGVSWVASTASLPCAAPAGGRSSTPRHSSLCSGRRRLRWPIRHRRARCSP